MASLQFVSKTQTSITVKIVDLGEDCSAYSGFEIRIGGTSVGSTSSCSGTSSGNMTASGLTAGTSYTIASYAYTNDWYHAGSGTWTTDSALNPPNTPSGLVISGVSDSAVAWSWNSTANTSYYEFVISGAVSHTSTTTGTGTQIGGLAPGSQVCLKVRACNADGCSSYTSNVCATTTEPEPDVPPSQPSVFAVEPTHNSVTTDWWPSTAGDYPIEGYSVRIYENCSTSGSGAGCQLLAGNTIGVDDTIWPHDRYRAGFSSLNSETYYEIDVRAFDTQFNYSSSERVSFLTLEPPPPPLDTPILSSSSSTLTTVDIVYNSVPNATSYKITFYGTGGVDTAAFSRTATFTGLTNGGTYYFYCEAFDSTGTYSSSQSSTSSIQTDVLSWNWTAAEESTFENNGDPGEIPYTSWNGFIDAINLIREDKGYADISASAKMTSVSKEMTAARFNLARDGIAQIGTVTISAVSVEDPVIGGYFTLLRDQLFAAK